MPTAGQLQALDELGKIADSQPGAITIGAINDGGADVAVRVGIDCRGTPHADRGVALRDREWFKVAIPCDFPFLSPSAEVLHDRWAKEPHVQFRRHLCTYVAPGVEWDPSDGMFGYLDRLLDWLRHAALGELDPAGAPLHPPVAYAAADTPTIVARADTPGFTGPWWAGFATLSPVSPERLDLVAWRDLQAEEPEDVRISACALLLQEPLPFEFPLTLSGLIRALEQAGAPRQAVYALLRLAAHDDMADEVYFVLGTAMRGIRQGRLTQHLTVWRMERKRATFFWTSLPKESDSPELSELRSSLADALGDWATHARVEWCSVREIRPEVTRDRAEGSPMQWFKDKSVAIWGCGALGSHIAECVVRSGAARLVLRDRAQVGPGVLARQCFDDLDIGLFKADALAARLKRIRPDLDVQARRGNLVSDATLTTDWTDGADLVIDASANLAVGKRLESFRRLDPRPATAVLSTVIGHDAHHGLLTFSPGANVGGPVDVSRKAKLAACEQPGLPEFADEFWPVPPRTLTFQPEPGCSEPTFTGSDADVGALARQMLLAAAYELSTDTTSPVAVFIGASNPVDGAQPIELRLEFDDDTIVADQIDGLDVRIAPPVLAEMRSWTRKAERAGKGAETGGVLFGEIDRAIGVVWVSDAIGPPRDSNASREGFVCGVKGVDNKASSLDRLRRGSSRPVGMWHTHPGMSAMPSPTDVAGMAQVVTDDARPLPQQLLLILGGTTEALTIGAFVFRRDRPVVVMRNPPTPATPSTQPRRHRRPRRQRR